MRKIAIYAFNGETMCFVHALLNAVDFHAKGYDTKLIIEGSAVKQVRELAEPGAPFAELYQKVKNLGLVDCVCQACSNKMESLEAAKAQELNLCGEMMGHPSMERYVKEGYEIIAL